MKRRILIHVGMPKCGSTGLQLALASNRETLLAAGIHYPSANPGRPGGTHHMPLVGDLVACGGGSSGVLADMIAGFDRSGAATMVLSSESFAVRAHRIAPEAFGALLAPFDVDLLLCIRRRDRWLLSFYKECVRAAPRLYRGSFAQFLAAPPPYARNLGGAMQANAATRLARLTGARSVHVVDLDTAGGDSRAAAARLLDFAVERLPGDPALLGGYYAAIAGHGLPANASLSDAKTAFLARIDRTAFPAESLFDLDVTLAITPLDDVAPDFRLMDRALSARLIAEGGEDRDRLKTDYGVPLPDPEPVGGLRSDPLAWADWQAILERIADRLQPGTRAALAAVAKDF